MEKAFSAQKFVSLILLCILISSCRSVKITGQYVNEKELNKISVYKMTKNEVSTLIGSPTYIPYYNQDCWYYIELYVQTRPMFLPSIMKQRIIRIMFDEYGIVDDAILLSNMPNDNLVIDKDVTKQLVPNQSWIGKLRKNFFRFAPN